VPVTYRAAADGNHREDADDEEIGGSGKQLSRFADATKVAEHQHHDEAEAERDRMRLPLRERGRNGCNARRNADRYRQDVVDQQ
jgi:hypothetical protein